MLLLGLLAPALAADSGLRVNGSLVFETTTEFVAFLKTAEPASIRLLEFSGDGSRLYQSIDEFADGHLENVLWYRNDQWRLTDKSGQQPDPDWLPNFERALHPEAMVFFYGCQTGWYDHSGLVDPSMAEGIGRAFSQRFQVTVIASPDFVYFPGQFPDVDGRLFSNPTEPATEGQNTPGGLWNVFRKGKWVAPPNRGATTLRGLPRPRVPGPPAQEKTNLKE
ncbi:MAG: hypothetical protein AB7S38_27780 [Vulcanimicrobiota bacterium]